MHDFSVILAQYGFLPNQYDFESTIMGFDYDFQWSLFDQCNTFDTERSRIIRQWNNPTAYLRCELLTRNTSTSVGLAFFLQRWVSELRYQTVTREILDITDTKDVIEIRALLISPHNAMTFHVNILPAVKEKL